MKKINQSPCYHNLFYARDSETDLKYKKDREAGSLDIWIETPGLNVARSYETAIANVNLTDKILLISRSKYSQTTAGQIAGILAACPDDFTIICTDDISKHPNFEYMDWVVERERKAAAEYFLNNPKITQRELWNYMIKLGALKGVPEYDYIRNNAAKLLFEYNEKLRNKRTERERKLSEKKQAKYDAFLADVDAGMPRIIARAKHNFIEPEYQECFAKRVFSWDGKAESCIRTSGGVFFRLKDAQDFLNFENWNIDDTILGRYRFMERGNFEGVDCYRVGCHVIPVSELTALRDLIKKIQQ